MHGSISAGIPLWFEIIAIIIATAILFWFIGWYAYLVIAVVAGVYLIFKWYKGDRPIAPT